jgi:5'-nucleotidase
MAALSATAWARSQTLVLATTSDLQGEMEPVRTKLNGVKVRLGGMARLAGAIKKIKAAHPGRSLALATGDDLMGRYFNSFQGKAIYEALNLAGMDLATLGNHEFDFGPQVLARALKFARFPMVVSNMNATPGSPLTGLFRPEMVVPLKGLRIGFLGLLTQDLALLSKPQGSVRFPQDLYVAAREAVAKLRAQKVDLVVALTHLGLDQDKRLAAKVGGIDVICGGHSHTLIPSGQEVLINRPGGGTTIIVQSGKGGTHLGRLTLEVEAGRVLSHLWEALPLDASMPSDPQVASLVASYKAKLPPPRVLAQTKVELDCRTEVVRAGEVPVGNLITDIVRAKFKTDAAFINAGNIRGDRVIPPGPVTSEDVEVMLPFANEVDILKLKGAALIKALEWGLTGLPQRQGRFLQVSGIRFSARKGKVIKAEVKSPGGAYAPLNPEQTYSAATNTYLAGGGDGFKVLVQENLGRKRTFVSLASLVEMSLERMSPIAPVVEGRIKLID